MPAEHAATHARLLARLSPTTAFASLMHDNRPVAWGLAVVERGWVGLFDLVVEPQSRRRGLGRQLINGLLAWAAMQGADRAYLQGGRGQFAGNRPLSATRLRQRLYLPLPKSHRRIPCEHRPLSLKPRTFSLQNENILRTFGKECTSGITHGIKGMGMTTPELRVIEGDKMDKVKALDAALAQIEKQFGKGSVMKLGQNDKSIDVPKPYRLDL